MPARKVTRKADPGTDAAVTPARQIDRYIEAISDWRGPTLAMIRRTMLASDPAVTEAWKWMGSPVWSCDGLIAVANAHKDKVKLTFASGAHLADVDRLFNAGLGGNAWRAIDIVEGDRPDEAALLRLVRVAVAYNRSRMHARAPVTAKKPASKRT